jgi:hypothetical protein
MLLVECVEKRLRRISQFDTYPTAHFAHQIANSVLRESATLNVELSTKRIRGITKPMYGPSPPGKSAAEIKSAKRWANSI